MLYITGVCCEYRHKNWDDTSLYDPSVMYELRNHLFIRIEFAYMNISDPMIAQRLLVVSIVICKSVCS